MKTGKGRMMSKVIAICNQKGGVGKTTTAIAMGAVLAELGKKVLLIDVDDSGNPSLSINLGQKSRSVPWWISC